MVARSIRNARTEIPLGEKVNGFPQKAASDGVTSWLGIGKNCSAYISFGHIAIFRSLRRFCYKILIAYFLDKFGTINNLVLYIFILIYRNILFLIGLFFGLFYFNSYPLIR